MLNDTLIVFDSETGGLDHKIHSLLTVAFLVIKKNKVVERREWKIKHPTYHVTEEAMKINGIDLKKFDKVAIDKERAGREIVKFLSKHCSKESKGLFVGQNTIFDKNFLETFLSGLMNKELLTTYKEIINHRFIDLISITAFLNMAELLDTKGLGLDKVIDKLQLNVKARHTAMDDAEVTWEALQRMIQLVKPGEV